MCQSARFSSTMLPNQLDLRFKALKLTKIKKRSLDSNKERKFQEFHGQGDQILSKRYEDDCKKEMESLTRLVWGFDAEITKKVSSLIKYLDGLHIH